jgi:DNA-binding HxlR family transcriptional regulator
LGKRHFEQFLASPEGIATNILADRLKRLTELGCVERQADPDDRRKSVYTLTDRGRGLRSTILELVEWGLAVFPGTRTLVPLDQLKKTKGTRRRT